MSPENLESAPDTPEPWKPGRKLLLGVLLVAAWLLWSGLFKPLLLGLGVVSCVLTLFLISRMGFFKDTTFAFHYDLRLLRFWAWLGREVIASSLEVARVVLKPKLKVDPRLVTIDVSQLALIDQALLGNSITLTPGTLTLDLFKGKLQVHALTAEGAAALQQGEMLRRVQALGSR